MRRLAQHTSAYSVGTSAAAEFASSIRNRPRYKMAMVGSRLRSAANCKSRSLGDIRAPRPAVQPARAATARPARVDRHALILSDAVSNCPGERAERWPFYTTTLAPRRRDVLTEATAGALFCRDGFHRWTQPLHSQTGPSETGLQRSGSHTRAAGIAPSRYGPRLN